MNDTNFTLAMAFTGKWEGLYSKDPVDPGGETYKGISRKYNPDWEGWPYVDSGNWQEANKYVDKLYYDRYWLPSGCDRMTKKLSIVVFDSAVNCGVKRAKSWVADQNVVLEEEAGRASRFVLQARLAYYSDLVSRNPAMKKYIRGWTNRVNDLSKYIDIV